MGLKRKIGHILDGATDRALAVGSSIRTVAESLEVPQEEPELVRQMQIMLLALQRAQKSQAPSKIENPKDLESIESYISQGGRLSAIDYNQIEQADREKGFELAREFLNEDMYSEADGICLIVSSGTPYTHPNPNDQEEKFGKIHPLRQNAVDPLMNTVTAAKEREVPGWDGQDNLQNRIRTVDRAMALMFKEKETFAGLLALAGGKSGNEVFRDMQELFDFANNYRLVDKALDVQQVFLRSFGDTSISMRPLDKPLGIWQPFNFPCIGIGEMIANLIVGNTIVIHSSAKMVGPYLWAYEKFKEAGVPTERMHFVIPDGNSDDESKIDPRMSQDLAKHKDLGNICFTGSLGVATQLLKTQAEKSAALRRLDVKLMAEAGGYNPILIEKMPKKAMEPLLTFFQSLNGGAPSESDWNEFFDSLDKKSFLASMRTSLVDSACGLQGQKCSALHEVVIAVDENGQNGMPSNEADMLEQFIVAVMNRVQVADITKDKTADMGAQIDIGAKRKIAAQMQIILDRGGQILTGDGPLEERMTVEGLDAAMKPIVYRDEQRDEETENVEIFGPVFRLKRVDAGKNPNALIERAHQLGYALTGAVIAETEARAKRIRREIPQGVCYINGEAKEGSDENSSCPTTTAAPAPQVPFGGVKSSGTGSGLLRPGNALHPLQYADLYSEANRTRRDWGQNEGRYKEAADLLENPLFQAILESMAVTGVQVDTRDLVKQLQLIEQATHDRKSKPSLGRAIKETTKTAIRELVPVIKKYLDKQEN